MTKNMNNVRELSLVAIDHGIDDINAKILDYLLTETSIDDIASKLETSNEDIENRITTMRKNGIIERFAPIINPLNLWNHQYFILIKAALAPPVVSLKMEYPSNWKELSDVIDDIIEKDELFKRTVRQMYSLQGTEWDLIIIVTVNDRGDLREICEKIADIGFVDKMWSFEPIKGTKSYFNPIGIPSPEEIKSSIDRIKIYSSTNKNDLYESKK